jgi:hypothetical protein
LSNGSVNCKQSSNGEGEAEDRCGLFHFGYDCVLYPNYLKTVPKCNTLIIHLLRACQLSNPSQSGKNILISAKKRVEARVCPYFPKGSFTGRPKTAVRRA